MCQADSIQSEKNSVMRPTVYNLVAVMLTSAIGYSSYGQRTNSAFERFMNRAGESLQKGLDSVSGDKTDTQETNDIPWGQSSGRMNQGSARSTDQTTLNDSSNQQTSSSKDNGSDVSGETIAPPDDNVASIPLPALPSYIADTTDGAIEKKPVFPKVKLFGVLLGMDVDGDSIEEIISENMNGRTGLRLIKSSSSGYALIPKGARNSDGSASVLASFHVENGQVQSISSIPMFWELPDNTLAVTQDEYNNILNARFGIEFDSVGQAKADGPQIGRDMSDIKISLPESKGDSIVEAENNRINTHVDQVFPRLSQSFLGLNLGESLESVMTKCEAMGIKVTMKEYRASGDVYGVPKRQVDYDKSLAVVDVCRNTQLTFVFDKLASIYCDKPSREFVASMNEKYGWEENSADHTVLNIDGQSVEVRLHPSQYVIYDYIQLISYGERYAQALSDAIQISDDIKRRNQYENLDY